MIGSWFSGSITLRHGWCNRKYPKSALRLERSAIHGNRDRKRV